MKFTDASWYTFEWQWGEGGEELRWLLVRVHAVTQRQLTLTRAVLLAEVIRDGEIVMAGVSERLESQQLPIDNLIRTRVIFEWTRIVYFLSNQSY